MSYDSSPVIDVRKWLWNELQVAGIMDSADYNVDGIGLMVPIIPIQQQQEFTDRIGGKPFITYDFVTEYVQSGLWYINCEQILFSVYCDDWSTSSKIKNLMIDLFRRQDDSAKDLNAFSTSGLGYLNVTIVENRWTRPERGDTGRNQFDMIIEVKYVRELTSNGRYS